MLPRASSFLPRLLPVWALLLGALCARSAHAQTWAGERTTPGLDELVAVDQTGERSWLFGSEDVAGDGPTTFLPPEQAADVRSAYAATDARRLWLRLYVSADTAPATLRVYAFIDNDRNADTGGSARAPEVAAELDEDADTRGYEFVLATTGQQFVGAWRWSDAAGRYEAFADLAPLEAVAELGVDLDPLRIGSAENGYVQASLNLDPFGLTLSCEAQLLFRSSAGAMLRDGDVGAAGPCRPTDANGNRVADVAESDASCTSDEQCPADGTCSAGRCTAPSASCSSDDQCPAGGTCSAGRCTAPGASCSSDDQCPAGSACRAGRCEAPLTAGEAVQGGALTCAASSGRSPTPFGWLSLMLLGAALAWRRRRAALLLFSAGACVLWPARAHAQLDVQRFKPAVTHDGWVGTEGTAVRHPDDRWELGLWVNYARNPLVIADANGELSRSIVSGRLGIDAVVSASLARRLAIGAALPLYVLQSGDAAPSGAGIGDLRLVPKLELFSDLEDGVGLALLAEVRLPTHTGDFSGGERSVEFVPKAALDHRFASGVRVGFNLGVALRSTARYLNVEAGNELAYAAALGYRFGGQDGSTELGVELGGGVGLSAQDPEEMPLELLGFVRHSIDEQWEILGGPGVGLLEGYGVPTFRVFAGVRFQPTSHDQDGDRISDAEDECPEDPEDRDGTEDADGCPEEDADFDHDGVADVHDQCPDARETINGVEDDDGCPDSGDRRVIYEGGHFTVLDTIRFETGSAEINSESHGLLDQVALTLKANPEIEHMRVEGHTDDTGARDFNMKLSEARAHSVRRYLIRRGVNPGRLRVRSYGPDRPVEQGKGDEARAKNRRVEFVLE